MSDEQDEPFDRTRRSENTPHGDRDATRRDSDLPAEAEAGSVPPDSDHRSDQKPSSGRQGLVNTKKDRVAETAFLESGRPSEFEPEQESQPKQEQQRGFTVLQREGADVETPKRQTQGDLPDNIPGFEIIDELGRGAFGVVYRAMDIKLDRQVAIKLPLLSDQRLAAKYVQEAKNAAKLDTFGIVPVFQVGTTDAGQPFVVQKLVDGAALDKLLREHRTLTAGDAVTIIHRVAKAIAEAHRAGLVHRDLKPANVLIDHNGNPWVADFGLAVFEEEQSQIKGQVAGTPTYMAPEQLGKRADWLDGRADIWAIGVMLYELLTGKPPFVGSNFGDLKEQILNRRPRPLSQRVPGIPTELDQIFNRCCAKQVDDRYANASLLADDLEKLTIDETLRLQLDAAGVGGGAARPNSILKNTRFSQSQLGRSTVLSKADHSASMRWIAAAVAAIALAGTIGFVAVWSRLNRPVPPKPRAATAPQDLGAAGKPPVGPLHVSKSGTGTHTTIASALAAAQPGDEIRIAPGTYRENLEPKGSIRLIGEGARDDVRIIGVDTAAITVTGAEVQLTNLTVGSDGNDLNSIEVLSGQLVCKGCLVLAPTYDCVKLHPGSSATLVGCDFRSGDHPAIVAKQAEQLVVENCDFRFEIPNVGVAREQPVVAAELTECGAVFAECNFAGIDQLGKGISARDSPSKLLISNCRFGGLLHAIELFRCEDVEVVAGNLISDCQLAVYSDACQGSLENLEVTGCDYGLIALRDSQLTVTGCQFKNNRRVGVWIDRSSLTLEQTVVDENGTAGILMDAAEAAVSRFRACQVTKNQIGLLLVGGRAEFELGNLSLNASAGVAVVDPQQLPGELQRGSVDEERNRTLYAKRVNINGRPEGPAVLFNAPGSYELSDCVYVDVPNSNRPALAGGLTSVQEGAVVRVQSR